MPMTLRSKSEPSAETPTEHPVETPTEHPVETPTEHPVEIPPIATTPFATQPSSTSTMTTESSQMFQLMAAMMELLQRNAAPIAATQPQPPAPVYRPEELLRTFTGEPQDDPEIFIAEVEVYFEQVGEYKLTPRVGSPPPAPRRRRQAKQVLP
jgi:hypothetical protein